jgi:hypothetical protein
MLWCKLSNVEIEMKKNSGRPRKAAPTKPRYGFFDGAGAGAGCEVAGGREAGRVLDCGVDGVVDGVVAGVVAGAGGVVTGAGFGAGLETFSRIELPCPTALSVRSTMAMAHSMNMTAHQVVAFESTLAAPRGPKAVWLPAPPKAPARSAALPLWSSTTMIRTKQFKMKKPVSSHPANRKPTVTIPKPINNATAHFIQPGISKTSLKT